jgi:hypothetical protein
MKPKDQPWTGRLDGRRPGKIKRTMMKDIIRWKDDVTDDLRKMGIRGWTEGARNRDQWRLLVKAKDYPRL